MSEPGRGLPAAIDFTWSGSESSDGESDPGHPEDAESVSSGQFTSDSRPLNTRPGLGDVLRVTLTPALLRDLRDSLVTSVTATVMFLSCCCRAQKDSSKKRKKSPASASMSRLSSGDSVSPEPGYTPRARLVFSPHSPIFTIQSQSNNVQSSSLSSEDFYYYQVHSAVCQLSTQNYHQR